MKITRKQLRRMMMEAVPGTGQGVLDVVLDSEGVKDLIGTSKRNIFNLYGYKGPNFKGPSSAELGSLSRTKQPTVKKLKSTDQEALIGAAIASGFASLDDKEQPRGIPKMSKEEKATKAAEFLNVVGYATSEQDIHDAGFVTDSEAYNQDAFDALEPGSSATSEKDSGKDIKIKAFLTDSGLTASMVFSHNGRRDMISVKLSNAETPEAAAKNFLNTKKYKDLVKKNEKKFGKPSKSMIVNAFKKAYSAYNRPTDSSGSRSSSSSSSGWDRYLSKTARKHPGQKVVTQKMKSNWELYSAQNSNYDSSYDSWKDWYMSFIKSGKTQGDKDLDVKTFSKKRYPDPTAINAVLTMLMRTGNLTNKFNDTSSTASVTDDFADDEFPDIKLDEALVRSIIRKKIRSLIK